MWNTKLSLTIDAREQKGSHSLWGRMMTLSPTFLQFFADWSWNCIFSFVSTDYSFSYINNTPNSQGFIHFKPFSPDLFDHNNSAIILITQGAFRGENERMAHQSCFYLVANKEVAHKYIFFLSPVKCFFPSCMLMKSPEKMLLISQSEKWQHSDLSMRGIPCLDSLLVLQTPKQETTHQKMKFWVNIHSDGKSFKTFPSCGFVSAVHYCTSVTPSPMSNLVIIKL